MKRYTELLPSRLKEIHDELVKDIKLTEIEIKDKALMCPGLKSKWLLIYYEEKAVLAKLRVAKAQKMDDYIKSHGQPGIPKIKTESEAKADETIKHIALKIQEQDEIVEYLKSVVSIMSGMNFDIKNVIDIIKMENS